MQSAIRCGSVPEIRPKALDKTNMTEFISNKKPEKLDTKKGMRYGSTGEAEI
jgi:hypothetical protein